MANTPETILRQDLECRRSARLTTFVIRAASMPEPLVDRHFLEKLERLTLQWQKSFNGLVGGHNLSRFPGPGQEFLDHRSFHQGDDLRAVNWRAYMRFEKLFLKMFQIEPRVPVRLLLDVSASMTAGPAPASRRSSIMRASSPRRLSMSAWCGWTAFLFSRSRHACSIPFFAAVAGTASNRPKIYLRALTPGGKTNYFETARQFLTTYPQRGLTIMISDFLDDADCFRPLQYLADFGHELLLVQIMGFRRSRAVA